MDILLVIPARYASTRFPGKPLADIDGKTMVQRVYEQARQAKGIARVVVATDDARIVQAVNAFGGEAVITSDTHPSGTDRCAEVVSRLGGNYDAVINVQGDEPFINPEQIEQVALLLRNDQTQVATLARKITHAQDITDPAKVKTVFDANGRALYFSRSPIPFTRNYPAGEWASHTDYYLHVGIYGYKTAVLQQLTQLPVSSLEQAESLEQLRWLQNGYAIYLGITPHESIGIDTPADLERVVNMMKDNRNKA